MMRRLVISYILRTTSSFRLSTPPPQRTLLDPSRHNLHEEQPLVYSKENDLRTHGSNHAVGLLHEAIMSNYFHDNLLSRWAK
ncbi:hypothetical protein Bca4012_058973 [Brassica carinata]